MIRAVVGAVRRAQDGVSPWLACLEADHRAIDDHFAAFGTALSEGRVEADALAAGAALFACGHGIGTLAFAPHGRQWLAAGAAGLRRHIWVEETIHFPPLREAGLFGPVLVMLREHGEIWALLDALDTDVAAGTSAARLAQTFAQLEEALEQHNLKEERILYPAGDQVLDATVAEAVRGALSDGLMPADWVCEMFDR